MTQGKILIVDDMELNREMLAEILEDYEIVEAADGARALELIRSQVDSLSVVLLDLVMPVFDGYKVLDALREDGRLENLPVVIITGEDSVISERKCFELGASDFIRKPFDEVLVKHRVEHVVQLYDYKKGLEKKIEAQTAQIRNQYKLLQGSAEILKKNNRKIIEALGTIVEYRNLESGEHVKRVMGYTRILAERIMADYPEYQLTPQLIDTICAASALHDIGKIAIPDSILMKPGSLTAEEFDYMKSHTIRGCEILKNLEDAWDEQYSRYSYEICRWHHERYDGGGYPDGLKGEKIPISAQLVSVADVYDALINERCYKEAYSKEKAFMMIVSGECGVFSPKLMQAFRKCREAMEAAEPEKAQ